MATNEFLPFATDPSANVLTQSNYQSLTQRLTGFVQGRARSTQVNKTLRQASVWATIWGRFVAENGNLDALDNSDLDALKLNLIASLQNIVPRGMQVFSSNGTFVVPAGVYRLKYKLYGAGGGGGGSNGSGSAGVGGGGGAYAESSIAVVPGTNMPVVIGVGGTGGSNATTPTAGTNGGNSSFAGVTAGGGGGGQPGKDIVQTSAAGAPGVILTGTPALSIQGQGGGFGVAISPTNVLGGIAGSAYGSPGPPYTNGAAGLSAPFPGCGGGGGAFGNIGGVASNGILILDW